MRSEGAVTVYRKLVRDRISEVIEANGGTARYRVLDPGELGGLAARTWLAETVG